MSTSSVNSSIRDGLRFRNVECRYGRRASVRISESSLNKTNYTIAVLSTNVVSFLDVCPLTNELTLKEWMGYHKQPALNP
jgi:hypothetical protein